MPRIRTIKPEFWDSPGTARASLRGRLFFIAMWNWADDYGFGTANAKQLVSFAFPNDPDVSAEDFPSLCKEVSDCFGVEFYTVNSRPYFAIPSWDKHQKTERRAKPRIPSPDQGEPINLGTSSEMQGSSGIGTGEREQGKGKKRESDDTPIAPPLTTIPDDWQPNLAHQAKAHTAGIDIAAATESFRNHAVAQGRVLANWDAGFSSWLASPKTIAAERERKNAKPQSKLRGLAELANETRKQENRNAKELE